MDLTNILITLLCTFLGGSAGFGFIQFLITRKDKQKEDAKKDEYNTLRKEFQEGLTDRENTGKKRYDEHKIAIEKMDIQHQKDFLELKKAIEAWAEKDDKLAESVMKIAEKQENIADGLVGLCHDKIIFSTDKITERGSITLKEKATLESMYEPYHKMGGNGQCRVAYEHVIALPVISDDEAKKLDDEKKRKLYEEGKEKA